jgi:hypothetical protein
VVISLSIVVVVVLTIVVVIVLSILVVIVLSILVVIVLSIPVITLSVLLILIGIYQQQQMVDLTLLVVGFVVS